jgi:hypothetical protein
VSSLVFPLLASSQELTVQFFREDWTPLAGGVFIAAGVAALVMANRRDK